MALTTEQLGSVANGNVIDTDGDKIGGVGQIYLDDSTGQPNWVTVKTGLFGASESFAPLSGASVSGSDIVVTSDKATVKDAPRVDADGHLSPDEEPRCTGTTAWRTLGPRVTAVPSTTVAPTTTRAPTAQRRGVATRPARPLTTP